MRRGLAALAALAVLAVVPRGAPAGPADYSPDNTEWQGLSNFFRLAREVGFDVEMRPELKWDKLAKKDIIFFLYPTTEIPPKKILHFLRTGGRVIIADDFGSAGDLLEQLGISRVRVDGTKVNKVYAGKPSLPIATPGTTHPLNAGIKELHTNHPAGMDTKLPAIFRFEPIGGAVVVAASLGKGRIVVVSDPSIFINRMLLFSGNQAFARKLLAYLGRPGEDRYVFLSQGFAESGTPTGDVTVTGPPPGGVSEILADANKLLLEFNEYLIDKSWIAPLATLLAGLLLALAVWALPMESPRYDASWTRPGEAAKLSPYERELGPYLAGGQQNFAYPACIVRDLLDDQLGAALGLGSPLFTLSEADVLRIVTQRYGGEAAAALRGVLKPLRRLPARDEISPQSLTPRVSFRELLALREAQTQLLGALGKRAPKV